MKPQQEEKPKKATCRPTQDNWQQLNRKQRREMTRKIQSEDLSLEVVHPDAAGIDIGNESHYVAVPPTRDGQPVRRFGCTTAEVKEMAVWLKQCAIRTIAMQSTGVYWIAVYDILEEAGFEVYLVNARESKNLPGRKSDVQESQWLMKLHPYGLLRNSFRPSQEVRTMRTYWRQRNDLVRTAGRHIQRIQKAMTQMNIQLANVLSDVSGMTGQAILKAILAGERDPYALAALRDWRVKASEEEIARSLEGNWQEDLLFVLQQEQESYEFCQKQIAQCDQRLQLRAQVELWRIPFLFFAKSFLPLLFRQTGALAPVLLLLEILLRNFPWSVPARHKELGSGIGDCVDGGGVVLERIKARPRWRD
jgi:hypothetical protein